MNTCNCGLIERPAAGRVGVAVRDARGARGHAHGDARPDNLVQGLEDGGARGPRAWAHCMAALALVAVLGCGRVGGRPDAVKIQPKFASMILGREKPLSISDTSQICIIDDIIDTNGSYRYSIQGCL